MTDSVFKQCLDQVATDILGLSLTGQKTYSIVVRWRPWDQYEYQKGITIHPAKNSVEDGPGTAGRDDVGYGCQVTICEPNHSDIEAHVERHLKWIQRIRKKFINQRLGTIASVHTCTVQTKEVPIPKAFTKDNQLAHAMIIRAWSRETRG